MTRRKPRLSRHASLLLVALSSVWTACGKTNDGAGTDAGNTSVGGSGANGGTGGGPASTGAAVTTAGVAGSGSGSSTTGSGGSGGFGTTGSGGSGGDSSCAPAQHLLEGCYSMEAGAAGQGGLAGAAGGEAGGSDPCWGADAPRDCSASFEGQVSQVGRGIDARWCDSTLFGGLTNLSDDGRQWLVIDAGDARLRVVIGRPSGELDIEVGDTVQAELYRHYYFEDFDWGSRLTLRRNGQPVVVLNDGFPVDDFNQYGDLALSWGRKLCERPYDGACTYIAHDLDLVWEEDGGTRVAPYSRGQLGPFEILTQGNFIVEGAGFCDSGNQSEYLIARVKR